MMFHQRDAPLVSTESGFGAAMFFYAFVASGGLLGPLALFWLGGLYAGGVWMWRILPAAQRLFQFSPHVLNATPLGMLGVMWYTGVGILHRRHRLSHLLSVPVHVVRLITGFLLCLILITLLPGRYQPDSTEQFFVAVSALTVMLVVFAWVGQLFAVMSGLLIALVVGKFTSTRLLLQVSSAAIYVTLHIASAALTAVFVLRIALPLSGIGIYALPIAGAGAVLGMVAMAECAIRLLWGMLNVRLGQPFNQKLTFESL
ncbi:MAG: hypothetical protein AAF125_10215 [Chloroflexota bacterium]